MSEERLVSSPRPVGSPVIDVLETVAVNPPVPECLTVRGVTVQYGGVRALADVSLGVEVGEVCGIIGPNGAGKTTLFDAITGLAPLRTGQIWLDGLDITKVSTVGRARAGIRRTFQRQQVFSGLSVEDNVLAATEWRGGGGGVTADLLRLPWRRRLELARRRQADEVLEAVELLQLRDQAVERLTIGQQRMVELARAIVDRPRVLLLDEPTSGLEQGEIETVAAVVEQMRQYCALLIIEHDVNFIMQHSDRIVVLNLGEVLAMGTPEAVQASTVVQEVYLG